MKRLDRLTALISHLQSRRFTAVDHLIERFEVSERTIYRDLKSLEEAGIPIGYEKDRGYYILDSYFLPPVAFTVEEAEAIVLVEQLAKKYTDSETLSHFSSALEKIRNKLKNYQLDEMENLQSKVQVYINPDFEQKFLPLARQACSNRLVLKLVYHDFNGKETVRLIEPIGITFYSQSWHLIAFCRLRNDYRDFSLLRVQSLTKTGETFPEGRQSLEEYIKNLEEA